MIPYYTIDVRNLDGNTIATISDFVSMNIIDIKNNVGSWTIKSTTKDECPFTAGTGIVVYRNGILYYSGVLDKVESKYNRDSKSWDWTATGQNDLQLLKWRVIFPDVDDLSNFDHRYKTFASDYKIANAIGDLIRDVKYQEPSAPYTVHQIPTVGGVNDHRGEDNDGYNKKFEIETNFRMENLFDSVIGLCNFGGFTLRPEWDMETRKVVYDVALGKDLSDYVTFSERFDHIDSFTRILQAPDYTDVVMSIDQDVIWIYYAKSQINSVDSAESLMHWGSRETYVEPKEEELGELTYRRLVSACNSEAKKTYAATNGYDIEINSDHGAPVYREDYKLGDIVSIDFEDGTNWVSEVVRVQTDVSYGNETIRPYIGTYAAGTFSVMQNDISKLGRDVTRLKTKRGG